MDRRTAMLGLAAGGIAALGGGTRVFAQASHKVGDTTVRVLSDGHMMVTRDRLAAKPTDEAAFNAAAGAGQPKFAINVTLIETGGKRILIDAGGGGTFMDSAGKLGDALSAAGVDPASIDHVVITHAHPDHLWGVIDDFDNSLRFPKANYFIPKAEHEFWTTPGKAETAGAAEGSTAGARRVLKAIEPRLRTVGEGEFLPGLAYLAVPGHTPGQSAVIARNGSNQAMITADTLFHPIISVRHPEWAPLQDMDAAVAVASRKRVLDIAAATKSLVVAYHIDGPGRVTKDGTGFRWDPA